MLLFLFLFQIQEIVLTDIYIYIYIYISAHMRVRGHVCVYKDKSTPIFLSTIRRIYEGQAKYTQTYTT